MDIALLSELAKWEETISAAETGDPLWKLHAYRVARYLLDACLADIRDGVPPIHPQTADQLRRAVGSIGANLSEGYSRRTPHDRVRFYSYALGSLREAAVWYLSVRAHLSAERLQQRLDLIAQLRRLVLGLHGNVSRGAPWSGPKRPG
jgi:four helix bundle protein